MPNQPQRDEHGKQPRGKAPRKDDQKKSDKADEVLREQSKTETEERPYLDTEGGE
jgi:hypothetical protein